MQCKSKNKTIKILVALLLIFTTCFLQNFYCLATTNTVEDSSLNFTNELNAIKNSADLINDVEYKNGAKLTDENLLYIASGSEATLNINIEKSDKYVFYIKYKAEVGFGGNIEMQLLVDGKLPFDEANCLVLPRLYEQEEIVRNDRKVDDVQPKVVELEVWQERFVYDNTGYSNLPFEFDLKSGNHTLTVTSLKGGFYIDEIGFCIYEELPTYEEYSAKFIANAQNGEGETLLQAEDLYLKTDTTVLPKNDSDSADTIPQSASLRLLNTLGGSIWKSPRSSVTWKFNVEKNGIYYISARYIQSFTDGIFSSRKVLIDGKCPFAEFENVKFNYSDSWKQLTFGDGKNAYGIYLNAGEHTLTLEAVVGDLATYLYEVDSCLTELNDIYREIVIITGTSPDIYRDYGFEDLIPQEIEDMKRISLELEKLSKNIVDTAGVNAGYTAIIDKIIFQIEKMTARPRDIAKYLTSYKSNLGSLATWVLDSTQQPLQLDWIYIGSDSQYLYKGKGFFDRLRHSIIRLLTSYVRDYNFVGVEKENAAEELAVWTQTGRDQAEVLRQLVATRFSEKFNVSVKLQVVPGSTLLPALAAGTGPDVVLNTPSAEPINFAIRGAIADLTQFENFEEISQRFFKGSIEPFMFEGKAYALPETYTFPMFFYRKDIFEEYGWKVPQTFEEMKTFTAELQSKDMNMSLPATQVGFGTILYQNGGTFYNDGGKSTALGSDLALSSFEQFMKWYTLYTLPASASFVNRFRTGEMPCGIEDYSIYNTLVVYAPEIAGLWEMVPIPGTLKEDGSIDRSTVGTSLGTMITSHSDNKDTAWKFVCWWLSEEIQSEYGKNLESILGAAAKYNTANMSALKKMTWSYQEYKALTEQAQWARAIPEVPGGYYLSRTISFAFSRSYNSSTEQSVAEEPTEVMKEYIDELNTELKRKRKEFGLEE